MIYIYHNLYAIIENGRVSLVRQISGATEEFTFKDTDELRAVVYTLDRLVKIEEEKDEASIQLQDGEE